MGRRPAPGAAGLLDQVPLLLWREGGELGQGVRVPEEAGGQVRGQVGQGVEGIRNDHLPFQMLVLVSPDQRRDIPPDGPRERSAEKE